MVEKGLRRAQIGVLGRDPVPVKLLDAVGVRS